MNEWGGDKGMWYPTKVKMAVVSSDHWSYWLKSKHIMANIIRRITNTRTDDSQSGQKERKKKRKKERKKENPIE